MMEHIVNFLITTAHAESTTAASPQGGGFSFIFMFAIFFFLLYFAFWRPQSKRAREQQNLINSLAKGDEVVTAGGILGRISKITDQYVVLSLANDVDIVMQKTSIVNVLPKGTLKSLE